MLVLFGIHQHQLAMERTRINFSVFMQDKDVVAYTSGKLDGQPLTIGQKISLGSHTLTLINSKAEPFTTNFFCWYGGRDFGQVNLKRSMGGLNVTANPAAPIITITGPEFSLTLTNSTGTNLTVPTDTYEIHAEYLRWDQNRNISVPDRQTAYCGFLPRFGVLQLTCNHDGATYRLQLDNGQVVASGNLPVSITNLPSERYQAIVTYHNRWIQRSLLLKEGVTNDVPIEFNLGTARLESEPDGATVETLEGGYLGQTPLDVADLLPQPASFRLSKPGYESATVTLGIVADQTTTYRTNLVSLNYRNAMQSARQALAATNYLATAQAIDEALAAKPGDTDALAIKSLIDEQVKDERQLEEQLKRPRKVFDTLCDDYQNADLFQEYVVKTPMPAQAVSTAIVKLLQTYPHAFTIKNSWAAPPDTYETVAEQSFTLGILGGNERICLIVVGQTKPGETQILFRVLEYEVQHELQVSGLLDGQDVKKMIPLNSGRVEMTEIREARLRDGVQMVLEKIKSAVGEP